MSITNYIWIVQEKIHEILIKDNELKSLVSGVYNHLPFTPAPPYITITATEVRPWLSVTATGSIITYVLESFTRDRTPESTLLLLTHIRHLLDGVAQAFEGCILVELRYEQHELRPGSGNRGYGASISFTALVEQTVISDEPTEA